MRSFCRSDSSNGFVTVTSGAGRHAIGVQPAKGQGGNLMCDYSLHLFPNRLANQGEELVVHRFGGGSIGLASPADLNPVIKARTSKGWSWKGLLNSFRAMREPARVPAVCVPPGSTLLIRDMPRPLQKELGVLEAEEVRFAEISADANIYRDAIRFRNGRLLLLQALREGQRVRVLSLDLAEDRQPTLAEMERALR